MSETIELWPQGVSEIVRAVEQALRVLVQHQAPGRLGGFLAVAVDGEILHHGLYGRIPAEKVERYRRLSVEKVLRLRSNPTHLTSYESRYIDRDELGGAVAAGRFTLGFSGLSEEGDSVLCLLVARNLGLLAPSTCEDLAEVAHCLDLFRAVASAEATLGKRIIPRVVLALEVLSAAASAWHKGRQRDDRRAS